MTFTPIVPNIPIIQNASYYPAVLNGAGNRVTPNTLLSRLLPDEDYPYFGYDFEVSPYPEKVDSSDLGGLNMFAMPQNNIFTNYQPIQFDFSQNANTNANWGFLSKKDEYSQKLKKINTEFKVSKVPLSKALDSGLKFVSQKHKDRWDSMDTSMQNELIKLADYAKSKGITIYINSSVRTEAEQNALIAKGAPAAKKHSKHLTGRAVDINVSGPKNKNLAILGKYWRDQLGHRWGQDFKHPRPEPWHFDIG